MLAEKKRILIVLGVLFLVSGCSRKASEPETTGAILESVNEESSAEKESAAETEQERESAAAESEEHETKEGRADVTEGTEAPSFVGALTEQDVEEARKAAEAYYETAYRKAENLVLAKEEVYAMYAVDDIPGNVIIFQGNEAGASSLIRYIVLKKSSEGWIVVNEGY